MITREEFMEQVVGNIQGYLPAEYADKEVRVHEVNKPSGNNYMGMTLVDRENTYNVTPVINLDMVMEHALEMDNVTEASIYLAEFATKVYENNKLPMDTDDLKELVNNYERAKDNLTIVPLCEGAKPSEIPVMERAGMQFTAKVKVASLENGKAQATAVITDNMLKQWGVDKNQVFEDAINNYGNTVPVAFMPMSEVIDRMAMKTGFEGVDDFLAGQELEPMFVLSTKNGINGAGVLLSDSVLEDVSDRLGGINYFVIPSSIHEALVVPVTGTMGENMDSVRGLTAMVQEVNESEVAPDEVLANELFHYDASSKTFGLAKDYVNALEMTRDELQKAHVAEMSETYEVKDEKNVSPKM